MVGVKFLGAPPVQTVQKFSSCAIERIIFSMRLPSSLEDMCHLLRRLSDGKDVYPMPVREAESCGYQQNHLCKN